MAENFVITNSHLERIRTMFTRIAFLIASALLVLGQNVNAQYPYEIGQVHPDFVFPDIETGDEHQLSDFRGKKLILINFASW